MGHENFRLVWQNTLGLKNTKSIYSTFPSTNVLKKIIARSNEIKDQTIVIKLPSVVINQNYLLLNFIDSINVIRTSGAKIVIVHDYKDLIEGSLKIFGMKEFGTKEIDRNYASDFKKAQIIETILCGFINRYIINRFNENNCYAIGISGKDGNLMRAKKSKQLNKRNDSSIIDLAFISEPVIFNPEILLNFEDMDIVPVITPLATDEQGNTHILDVDLTAAVVANFLDAEHFIIPVVVEDNKVLNKNIRTNDIKILKNILNDNITEPESVIKAVSMVVAHSSDNNVYITNAQLDDFVLLSLFNRISDRL